jgi:hypothetical protein
MKKIALFVIIAALGLQGSRADNDTNMPAPSPALPPGFTSVHLDLMMLEQGTTNRTPGTTRLHFKTTRFTDDDLLGLINDEFETTYATAKGDQLVVSNIWGGDFSVLSEDGNVLLANASLNTNGDQYHLYFQTSQPVRAGVLKINKSSLVSVTDGDLSYSSGDGSNTLHIEGLTTVDDELFFKSTNNKESFRLTKGTGSKNFPDDGSYGVIRGEIYGRGKDNLPVPPEGE